MRRVPWECKAILFDAVGTLIHPEPAVGWVYAEAGRRFGSRLPAREVVARFRQAFVYQDEIDRRNNFRTDEKRELERWRAIVKEVLDDLTDPEAGFQFLYDHFARSNAWRLDPHSAAVLNQLAARGLALGMASNLDRRLHGVVEGMPDLALLSQLVISSEIGWRKPAPQFFAIACKKMGFLPSEVLFVGDDPENDLWGARGAGLPAILFDPKAMNAGRDSIRDLRELLS